MSDPKRLHPIAAVVNGLRQLKEMIIPFLIFVVFGSRGTDWDLFYFFGSIGVVVLVLVYGVLSWYRFTYRIEQGELRIEYGLIVRKKRYIPFDRIQSLDLSEGILQRLFGLVKVKVETAGSGGMGLQDGEAVLTAITKQDAHAIHDYLVSIKKSGQILQGDEEPQSSDDLLYKMSVSELLMLATTSGGVGVVISAVFAFVFQFEEFIPYEQIFDGVENFVQNGVVFISVVVFIGFLLAWMIALFGTMLKYANFTVRKVDNDLVITRGLLEKRQFTIPLNRIQAVRISENFVRQPLGYASAYVESAGGSALDQESSKVLILPIVKKRKIPGLLEPHLTEYHFRVDLSPAPKRDYSRYLLKGWLFTLPIIIAAIWFLKPWGYAALILLPISALWSYLNYKDAGWSLDQGMLTFRYRNIVKNTVYMRKNKVQSFSVKESFFQRKKNLATVEAIVKSGHGGAGGKVIDLEKKHVDRMYRWYSHETAE
ncbi:PH domain-containing protein [Mesobacillus subterraneus]|uniref:PH domain-containing protein n=1 Tax=Mesobacillus subterraneus TaxID=285983 RepID=UPI00273E6477|nr:PH domain-containing protein [Mesobacillus subterraneus]WLR54963.1 PH domain-containing protein [Mesobacillus subterraneus]